MNVSKAFMALVPAVLITWTSTGPTVPGGLLVLMLLSPLIWKQEPNTDGVQGTSVAGPNVTWVAPLKPLPSI
jgi:hypothetical protein